MLSELVQGGVAPTRKRKNMDYQLEQDSYSKLEVQGLLDRYVQSECDKVRTDYSKKLKTAEDERDALKPKDKSETELVLDKRATELSKRERMLALKEINVPAEFADLIRDDADISKLSDLFRGVQGSYVPADHKDGGSTITKSDFSAMSYSKQAELYAQNPELYELLTK